MCRWFNSAPGHHRRLGCRFCIMELPSAASKDWTASTMAHFVIDIPLPGACRCLITQSRRDAGRRIEHDEALQPRKGPLRNQGARPAGPDCLSNSGQNSVAAGATTSIDRSSLRFRGDEHRKPFIDRDGEQASLSGRSRSAHNARDHNL